MKYLLKFFVSALLIFLVANYVLEGITLENGYSSALIFSFILSLVNLFLGNILKLLGFPINIITLGLFGFFVSILMIALTDKLYSGIEINGFLAYLFLAFLPSITGAVIETFTSKK